MKNSIQRGASLIACLLLAACFKVPDPADVAAAPQAAMAKPGFVNKVWEVSLSTGVEPGMLYVFLSDGTLVMTSPNSKAAFGGWTYQDGALTMIEESQEYKVDILGLSNDVFRIRSNNPGGSVEIAMVPAKSAPLGQ